MKGLESLIPSLYGFMTKLNKHSYPQLFKHWTKESKKLIKNLKNKNKRLAHCWNDDKFTFSFDEPQ